MIFDPNEPKQPTNLKVKLESGGQCLKIFRGRGLGWFFNLSRDRHINFE